MAKVAGSGLDQCQIVELPKIADPRGNLTFIEGSNHVPFNIARVYYLYDVPGEGRHVAATPTRLLTNDRGATMK